jgi:membrane associated rhomboid family serine protease
MWRRRSVIVWGLVAIDAVAFFWTGRGEHFYLEQYGFVPASPSARAAVSSMFLHAGWIHLIGNMVFLIVFGRPVEHAIGALKFTAAYLLAGVMALWLHAMVTSSPGLPVVGASGAVSGAVGMFLALYPRAEVDLHAYLGYWHIKTWHTTGLVATGVWFGEQLLLAILTSATGGGGGIAFWAHVGGFVCGVVAGIAAGRLALGYP